MTLTIAILTTPKLFGLSRKFQRETKKIMQK